MFGRLFSQLILLFAVVFLSASAFAEALPSFSASSFVESFANAMLTDLGKKLQELSGTYSQRRSGNYQKDKRAGKFFYAYRASACNQTSMTGPVADLNFTAITIDNALSQRIYYRGCNQNQTQFVELLQTRGGLQTLLTEDEILSGRRVFTLQGAENFRKYAIQDGNQSEIFAVTTTRIGASQWKTEITFKNKTLAFIKVTLTNDGEKVEIRKLPRTISDSISKGSVIHFDTSSLHFGVHWVMGNQIYMDLQTGHEISFSKMTEDLTTVFRNELATSLFKNVINMLLSDFPASVAPPSTSRIKNELTLLLAQVLSNPSSKEIPQLVQNLITILLNAINAGQIVDSRPLE